MDVWTAIIIIALVSGLAVVVLQRDGLQRKLDDARTTIALREAELGRYNRERRKPVDYPLGTVPVEVALAVHEAWRKAGYHMVGDTRVVLRLLSIAHRVMGLHVPSSLAPALYNDGDRAAPAKVQCQAFHPTGCAYPACDCEAVEPPPPPVRPAPNKPGKKG